MLAKEFFQPAYNSLTKKASPGNESKAKGNRSFFFILEIFHPLFFHAQVDVDFFNAPTT